MPRTVFFLQMAIPIDCHFHHLRQFPIDFRNAVFQRFDVGIRLVRIELQNTAHLDVEQLHDVVARDFPDKSGLERFQSFVDMHNRLVEIRTLFVFLVLIYALFDEYLFQRSIKQALRQFAALDRKFRAQQFFRRVDTVAQHVADSQEMRFPIGNDTTVWRDAHLAIGECIERVDGAIARRAGQQMHDDVGMFRRVVVDFAHLDFAFFLRLYNRFDDGARRAAVWDVGYFQRLVVDFLDFRTDTHRTATLAVVVFRHINKTARRKVGIKRELLAAKISNGSIENFIEIVRQYFGRKPDGNALRPLRQQQREFHRERQRLRLAPVVGHCPIGRFRVEHRFERKFRKARFDISRRGGTVARQDVAPVSLRFHKQFFLPDLHKRVADGSIAVGVVLHRVAHNVGHLVETAVVQLLHRMKNAPLHRLQSILNVRHRTFKDDIRGIIEKPILEHSRQMAAVFFRHNIARMGFIALVVEHVFNIFVVFFHKFRISSFLHR